MTAEWKQAIRNKRKYAVHFAKSRTVENLEMKKKYRNIATQERRKAIKAYWHKKSEELKSRPNEFFNAFRPFISTKTKDPNSICLQSDGGILEKDQTVVAERLASYFTHTVARIGGENVSRLTERDHDNHSSVMEIRKAYKDDHFDFEILRKEQAQDPLKSINPKKSCGWDPRAPLKLLKKVACGVAPSLTSLYNNCIKLSQWPTAWKKGEWTPVYKKGDRQEEKNYRPITSLVCVDKIFEHLLSKQIVGHFDSTLYQ